MKKIVCKVCGGDDVSITEGLDPNDGTPIREYFTDVYESDGGLCFCNDCMDHQPFHVIKDETVKGSADPWLCKECGSLDIQHRVWIDVNTGEVVDRGNVERDDLWCADCREHTGQTQQSELLRNIDAWWAEAGCGDRERVTGLRRPDFDPDDGFRAFADACNDRWNALSTDEKISAWNRSRCGDHK
jgi:hypothetical protein